jgi:mono/diheme cytochrome c family protein
MTPKPANLLLTVKEASDAYLFWRISEGGRFAPFNSRMSSFKGELNENQIWQVISYLQSLK